MPIQTTPSSPRNVKTTNGSTNTKKTEVELISERVAKTKNEIEHLKAQLEKLIKEGMKPNTETKNVIAQSTERKTDIRSEIALNSNSIKENSDIDIIKAKTFKDNIADIINENYNSPGITLKVPIKEKHKSPIKQPTEEVVKKVRSYDQKEAREFIKKQRERRKELMKNKKNEVIFTADIKKQRLQELRKKSLELVSKNLQNKRERSRSRELINTADKKTDIDPAQALDFGIPTKKDPSVDLVSDLKIVEKSKPKEFPIKHEHSSRKKFAHPHLKNITVRSTAKNLSAIPKLDIPQVNIGNSLMQDIEKLNKAATKIQTFFRGYRQRKLFKSALKFKNPSKEKVFSKEVQTVTPRNNIPAWLQTPTTMPYPYNFINAVKRKLNLAIQQTSISRTNDVAVQSSPVAPEPIEQNIQENNDLATDEHKNKSVSSQNNSDLRSFLSHKCLELDVKTLDPPELSRKLLEKDVPSRTKSNTQKDLISDSDTSKNIPDISSESSIPVENREIHSSKQSHISNIGHDEHKLKINTEKVKNLKLRQPKQINFNLKESHDPADSDTMKPNSSSIKSEKSSESTGNSENHIKSKSSSKFKNKSASVILTEPDNSDMYPVKETLSRRDSIIASNKCDYVNSSSIPINGRTRSISELKNRHSSTSLQPSIVKTKSSSISTAINDDSVTKHRPSVKTNSSSISTAPDDSVTKHQDTLHSFQIYMKNLQNEKENSLDNIKNKTSKSPQENHVTWEKTSKNGASTNRSQNTYRVNSAEVVANPETDNVNTENVQTNSVTESIASSVPLLKRPTVTLKRSIEISDNEETDLDNGKNNIILKLGKKSAVERKIKSNEIHLKFEAELHLLNEFNDSLRQVMAVEKSLLELQNNKNLNDKKPTTTQDTQTSFVSKTATNSKITPKSQDISDINSKSKTHSEIHTINYSRGSEVTEQIDLPCVNNSIEGGDDTSIITTGLEFSQLKDTSLISSLEESNVDVSVSVVKENRCNGNIYAGLSLDMFEQLIKDEDARIENLKTILKIREKALVDRTKGELAWLEIQKKHLRDSGQLQEISAIKKKQRGLLIKLEHERHEMQRLKQMQKAASKERKSVLKEQRNMIKAQLSTNNMITKIKRNTKEERRHSGPLKVYNIKSHSESIRSETSMSRKSSATEEVVSVVSHSHSIISHVTEEILPVEKSHEKNGGAITAPSTSNIKTENVKRSLLMREVALQKRRKAAEELLQWHQRLVEEEGKIAELELAASAIINQIQTNTDKMGSDEPSVEKHKFKGSQLNLLWHNMTGREENKFNDQVTYAMSKITLERFCKDAKKHALGKSRSFNKKSAKQSDSVDHISEITQSIETEPIYTESVKNALSRSSSDERSKKYSKSIRSSSSIWAEIPNYQNNLSRIDKNVSKQSSEIKTDKDDSQITEYLSDFDSFTKEFAEVPLTQSSDNSKKTEDEQIKTQSVISEPQLNGDLHDDTSISENEDEINTITEITSKNVSKTDRSATDIKEIKENISPTETGSKIKIIDKKSEDSMDDPIITDNIIDEIFENAYTSSKSTEIIDDISSDSQKASELVQSSNSTETIEEKSTSNKHSTVSNNVSAVTPITSAVSSPSEYSFKNLSLKEPVNVDVVTCDKIEDQSETQPKSSNSDTKNYSKVNTEDQKFNSEIKTSSDDIKTESKVSSVSTEKTNTENVAEDIKSSVSKGLLSKASSVNSSNGNQLTERSGDKTEVNEVTEITTSPSSKNHSEYPANDDIKTESKVSSVSTEKTNTENIAEDSKSSISADLLSKAGSVYPSDGNRLTEKSGDKTEISEATEIITSPSSKNHSEYPANDDIKTESKVSSVSTEKTNTENIAKDSKSSISADLLSKAGSVYSLDSNRLTEKSGDKTEVSEATEIITSLSSKNHSEYPANDDIKTESKVSLVSTQTIAEDIKSSISTASSVNSQDSNQLTEKSGDNTEVSEATEIVTSPSSENHPEYPTNDVEKNLQTKTINSDHSKTESEVPKATQSFNFSLILEQRFDKEPVALANKANTHMSSEINAEQDKDELSEVSCQDTTINEELSMDTSTTNESGGVNNKKGEISEKHSKNIKEVSEKVVSLDKEISITAKGQINGISPQITENNNEIVDTEISIADTSSSKKTERPLSLSYGFVAKKTPTSDQNRSDKSNNNSEEPTNGISSEDNRTENSEEILTDTSTSYRMNLKLVKDDKTVENDEKEQPDKSSDTDNASESAVLTEEEVEDSFSQRLKSEDNSKVILKDHQDPEQEREEIENENTFNNSQDVRSAGDAEIPIKPVETEHIDVKKRVLEILADANIPSPRGDKSPRVQDLYVTAYDITSPDNSPELGSPNDTSEHDFPSSQHIYGSDEVEELLKKQLAIEQEIKEIQEQQKEQLPYLYLREIPNKPPPPYTPPIANQAPSSDSVLPISETQINKITSIAADILYNAYRKNSLQNIIIPEIVKQQLGRSNIDRSCFEFVFDLCKEAAVEHYKQFDIETGPSWMHLSKKSKLALGNPLNKNGLQKFVTKKIREFLGYETVKSAENIKRKWCSKKRDHVDELLMVECQDEEAEWTNYDKDELYVKDELAKEIMNMLISETAQVFNSILTKKTFLC